MKCPSFNAPDSFNILVYSVSRIDIILKTRINKLRAKYTMATKEQELTYQNIIELFNLAEKLLQTVKNNDDLNDALVKLKAIEPFIINSVHFSELLSESYIKILKDSNNTELKEDLAKYIAEIINSLTKYNNKLKVNSENE